MERLRSDLHRAKDCGKLVGYRKKDLKLPKEVSELANIKSAKKRIDIAKRNRLRNRSKRSEIKTYIKKFDAALEANSPQEAQELLKVIDRKLKRASLKSAYSKNAASRAVSRLQKRLNVASAQ